MKPSYFATGVITK